MEMDIEQIRLQTATIGASVLHPRWDDLRARFFAARDLRLQAGDARAPGAMGSFAEMAARTCSEENEWLAPVNRTGLADGKPIARIPLAVASKPDSGD